VVGRNGREGAAAMTAGYSRGHRFIQTAPEAAARSRYRERNREAASADNRSAASISSQDGARQKCVT